MTDLLHVIGVVVAAPSAMCLLMGSRDQTVWYTLDKIPIPPECLRLPIWAYVALHITAGARMLACVRMDSFSWPDGRPCRVAGQSQDQWHSSPRHASGSVSARQRGAPGTGSSRCRSR